MLLIINQHENIAQKYEHSFFWGGFIHNNLKNETDSTDLWQSLPYDWNVFIASHSWMWNISYNIHTFRRDIYILYMIWKNIAHLIYIQYFKVFFLRYNYIFGNLIFINPNRPMIISSPKWIQWCMHIYSNTIYHHKCTMLGGTLTKLNHNLALSWTWKLK